MRSLRLLSLLALFLLASSTVSGEKACPANVTAVQYHPLAHADLGIFVRINNSGPYEFLLDTGAQITVIEPALARELNLETTGLRNIVTLTSDVEVPLVSAAVVELGPVSVQTVRMAVEDLAPLHRESPTVRGILGNNFLSHFDMLIDNPHKLLCLDDSRTMQQSLRGEHVPILSNDRQGSASAPAILVSVHLPDDRRQGSVLRLDSGSNVPLLYVDHQAMASTRVHGSTIGKQAEFVYAFTPERNVRLGTQKEMQIAFAAPISNGRLYSKIGEDSVLPTALFNRIFISAAEHFVIFDPR